MRFADLDGSMIDVYQAATQMTDESGQTYPFTINSLLDKALGQRGLLRRLHRQHAHRQRLELGLGRDRRLGAGARRAGRLGRARCSSGSTAATARRSTRCPGAATSSTSRSTSAPVRTACAAMVPTTSAVGALTSVKRNGNPIPTTTQTIKGVEYAFFDAAAGSYEATYAVDDTGPAISNVTHAEHGDGKATINWDTDEPSDSRVDYGTNPDQPRPSQESSALTTSHGVQLTGLDPNTTYYYRVSSSDAAGNSSTEPPANQAPLKFTTPSASLTDTTTADFSAGTPDANTYVSETGDGEVTLQPDGRRGVLRRPGPAFRVVERHLGIAGRRRRRQRDGHRRRAPRQRRLRRDRPPPTAPAARSSSGRTSAVATSPTSASPTTSTTNWAFFSIRGDGSINARTNVGGAQPDTQLPSALIGSAHNYRIEWDASEVRYYVDGSLVVTHSANFGSTQMRPAASDFNAGGSDVAVDWLHMSPYPGAGSFTSRVLDAGQSADWGALSWIADTPAGTSVVLNVRTGNTPTPDGSWSSFTPINANGGDIPGNSRYLQYRADLSSSDQGTTPALSQVTASYNAGADTTPPTIVGRIRSRTRPGSSPTRTSGAVQRADGPSTINSSTIRLRHQGAGTDVPAAVTYSGDTATLDPERRPRPERGLQRHRRRTVTTRTATRSAPMTPGASRPRPRPSISPTPPPPTSAPAPRTPTPTSRRPGTAR